MIKTISNMNVGTFCYLKNRVLCSMNNLRLLLLWVLNTIAIIISERKLWINDNIIVEACDVLLSVQACLRQRMYKVALLLLKVNIVTYFKQYTTCNYIVRKKLIMVLYCRWGMFPIVISIHTCQSDKTCP